MPNVMFKRGLQANLPANGSALDGSFYLTTDTNRLYVGNGTDLVELNKSITVVNSAADLPTSGVEVGQFYYIKGSTGTPGRDENGNSRTRVGNILAVVTAVDANGENPTWVQVNPDTNDNDNDNDYVSSFSIVKDPSSTTSQLKYKWTLNQNDIDGHPIPGKSYTDIFTIDATDIAQLAGASVGTAVTMSGDDAIIKTTGSGSDPNTNFKLVKGDNISISSVTGGVAIAATDTTYHNVVDATNNTITLTDDSDDANGTTTFAAGNAIDVTLTQGATDKDGTVTIAHQNIALDPNKSGSDTDAPAFGETIDVVTEISRTAQGHIDGIKTTTITLPTPDTYDIGTVSADNTGKITVTLVDQDDNVVSTKTSNQDLYYTVNGTPVYNKGSIDFYTKAEIDSKINTLDGMTYKGVVPGAGLPSSNVKNGDTYKVNADNTVLIPGTQDYADIGDMFIATGTETNGVITSGLTWTYIPSGDDYDTTYDFGAANNVITLQDHDHNDNPQTVTIAGGNKLTASTDNGTITIDHDALTTTGALADNAAAPSGTTTLDYGDSFTVVHGAKADGYGHISEIQTQTFQLPAAPEEISYSLKGTAGTSTAGKIELIDGNDNVTGQIQVQSGNNITATITASGTGNKNAVIKLDHNTLTPALTNNTTAANQTAIDVDNGFTAITALGFDDYGHVSSYTNQRYTLPDDVLVTLTGGVSGSNNTATVAFDLKDKGAESRKGTGVNIPTFSMSTSSLKIVTTAATASAPGNIAIDLEWGTF